MPPMARTSRATPAVADVNDLDNLDLDDMFAADNDDLFLDDDLGIDLGNMDDITSTVTSHPSEPEEAKEAPSPRRRKTKRKTKTPMIYDDSDDEEPVQPAKKKKKTTPKTKKSKKTPEETKSKSKAKGKKSVSMPPPGLPRGVSSSGSSVAAAGQFGRRSTIPKSRSKKLPTSKGRASSSAAAAEAAAAQVAAMENQTPAQRMASQLTQMLTTHAGLQQGAFCGLGPSSTKFYPFMEALPAELSMKHRKIYALVERIHASLASLQGGAMPEDIKPAKESDAIFKLIEEAHKEPINPTQPPIDRNQSICNAIGRLRHTVLTFDGPRLAADLYALAALLKKQHDFLKQNSDNMQKWCQNHLSPEGYAEVYVPQPRKRKSTTGQISVLGSFKTSHLKVHVVLPGFKEPKGILLAVLPPHFAQPSDISSTTSAPKSKKRRTSETTTRTPAAPVIPREKAPLTYADCKPAKRRKMMSDLIARTARELETQFQRQSRDREQLWPKQATELRKLREEDEVPAIHTAGMWKWLEKSNIFSYFTENDIRDRLSIVQQWPKQESEKEEIENPEGSDLITFSPSEEGQKSLSERLTSLLVEEEFSDTESESSLSDIPADTIEYSNESFYEDDETMLDLAALTVDEKAALHLKKFALIKDWNALAAAPTESSSSDSGGFPVTEKADLKSTQLELPTDIEGLIGQMSREVIKLSTLNHNRAAFLESLALSEDHAAHAVKQRKEAETAAAAKCQVLVKRNRDSKMKSGKKQAKDDDLALPW